MFTHCVIGRGTTARASSRASRPKRPQIRYALTMRLVTFVVAAAAGSFLSGAALWACAPGSTLPTGSGVGGGSGGNGGMLFTGSGGTGGAGAAPDANVPDNNCGYSTEKANTHPVTLYLMVDKSSSMAGFKWDAAVAGLTAFV